MKLRAKFIFVISFAFSMPLFAGKIKTQFQDEPLRANQVSGGLVSVSEDGSQNAKDVPLRVTRAGIVRTPKENIFGQIVPDEQLLFRSTLSKRMQDAYDEIYTAVINWRGEVFLQTQIDAENLHSLLLAVRNDNPELFWWVGNTRYWFNSDNTVTKIEFTYIFPLSQAQSYYDEFCEMSNPLVFYASLLDSDMEKIKYIHDFLCLSIEYDYDSYNSGNYGGKLQSAWSAITEYKTVCAGYARAFQYYMQQLLIPCAVIESNSHAWNILKVDGKCYEMDVTWDDNHLYPPYFNLNHSEMCALDSHSPEPASRRVINENPDGNGEMSYVSYFGALAQGEPYTYKELSNLEKDLQNPSAAVIYRKEVTKMSFVSSITDFENTLKEAVDSASGTQFSIKFIASDKNISNAIVSYMKNSSKFASVLRARWKNCGYSYSYSYTGEERNISYQIDMKIVP